MRILVFNYEFPPVGGGASQASFYMARELAKRGHQIDILTCRAGGQPEFEIVEGVSVYRVKSIRKSTHEGGLRSAMSYLFYARIKLRQVLREYSYDFGHFYFAIPTGLLAFQWRKMTDAPYIISLRGSDVPNYNPNANFINFLHRLLKPVTSAIMRHANYVVANSEFLRRLALETFKDQKIITITNGICPHDFTHIENKNQDKTTVTALCVSRLIPRKAVNVILDAIAVSDSPDLRLIIAGGGPRTAALIAQAKRLKIDDRIKFLGEITDRALLVANYQQADFLVHPTLTESFSMTLLEAMSCGLPVIACDVGGVPELVEHEINGLLVAPDDVHALADAIDRIAQSGFLRERYSRINRKKILDHFTWAHIAQQYETHCFQTPDTKQAPAIKYIPQ
jgi:glycosyltransferase involved in cell wall biosynthesis